MVRLISVTEVFIRFKDYFITITSLSFGMRFLPLHLSL